jgi:RND family efflux transporter MFP subunit
MRSIEGVSMSGETRPKLHERVFWRKLALYGATRAPSWWVKYSPPVFGWAAAALVPSARRAVRNNLRRIRGTVDPLQDTRDVLATFAAETIKAEVAQARANLAQAEASAAEAVGNADRARRLQGTGALSAAESHQLLTGEKTAQARVLAARAALQAQEVRLSQASLEAPDDGIISARSATVGAVVAAGAELFRLIRQGRLEWRAEVTSSELGRLVPGTAARITAASGAELQGLVRTIGPTVDPQSRTALVYVDVKPVGGPAAGSARAGMFARGEFDLGTAPALTVPQAAVVVREGFSYVFRVEPDGRVARVKIQPGRIAGDRIEVTAGLPADARIVANGAGFLNDGDLVRVADAPPAAAPRAAPKDAGAGK